MTADDSNSQPLDRENNESPAEDAVLLEWTCHPMRRRPWVTAAVTLFIIVVTMAVFYSTDSRAFGVLALVILLLSLAKFYFPTTYQFTTKQVVVKTTTQTIKRDWSQYRSAYPDKNGVLLSPFARPSRMENFRGLYVMFNDNRDDVMSVVRDRVSLPDEDDLDEVKDTL